MAGGIRESLDDDEMAESHEINVTPFIDVMLVLLIIFMVAAPLSTVDVNVDLPVSNAAPTPRAEDPVFITLRPDLSLAIGNDDLSRAALGAAIDAATGSQRDRRIFLRADQTVPYGALMEVMNLLRDAGYLQIALVAMESTGSRSSAAPDPAASDQEGADGGGSEGPAPDAARPNSPAVSATAGGAEVADRVPSGAPAAVE